MARKSKAKKNQTQATTEVLATPDIQALSVKDAAPLPKDKEEEELEKLLFGDIDGFKAGLRGLDVLEESDDEAEEEIVYDTAKAQDLATLNDDQLFFVDDGDDDAALVPQTDGDVEMTVAGKRAIPEEAPAWEDSDDEKLEVSLASVALNRKLRDTAAEDFTSGQDYSRRLRRQFERTYPVPSWSLPEKSSSKRRRLSGSDESSDDSDIDVDDANAALSAVPLAALLASTESLTLSKTSKVVRLRPEVIDIARLTDANVSHPSKSAIQCLSFHPSHPLLLTAGLDSTLRLYHIDGKTNPVATSLHIRGSAIQTALIHPAGAQIVAGGRRRYYHSWDLQTGSVEKVSRVYGHQEVQKSMERFELSPDGRHNAFIGSKGTVQILNATTHQWVATAKVEGVVTDISWHPDGETLSIANTAGEVYEYVIDTKSFSAVWRDEGAVSTTQIANSPINARFVAVGSASGIVNIYDRNVSFGGQGPGAIGSPSDPKPVKTVESLVTSISSLEFSRDGQVLCIASKNKRDALRLVHLPSCTIYKNWPTANTPLGKVTAVKWGGNNGGNTLAIGNEAGKVRLFELRG